MLDRLIRDKRLFGEHMAALRRIEEIGMKIGTGVEWENAVDGCERFGVVMTAPYEDPNFSGIPLVDCTVDTFRGDPRCTVAVEASRLRPRC